MNKREEYLNQIWPGYPPAPRGAQSLAWAQKAGSSKDFAWVGGEVLQLSKGELWLVAQGVTRCFQASEMIFFKTSPDWVVEEVLRSGDKVVVRLDEDRLEVMLLAPAWREGRKSPLSTEVAQLWPRFLTTLRAHFNELGFIEVNTPTLVPNPGYEPTLEPFAVELRQGREKRKLFLPTSPELHLKKMLCEGWSEIFEIRSCFRNDEFSEQHQPEFTMLEWYRSYCGLGQLADDLEQLVRAAVEPANAAALQFKKISVADLFQTVLNFKLTPQTTGHDLHQLWRSRQNENLQNVAPAETWNDLYHRLWVEYLDPWLAQQKDPVIVTGFPPSQAALSRIGEDGWAERLELYWSGLEIANGFHELNNPFEQRKRAEADLAERQRLGLTKIENDEQFLLALESGMAPGVGIAVGLERLFMAIYGERDIKKLKAFPY
ncbi:MAG: amino acid--tRNA ligase-related protein [Bdellovibrionales bacterium]